MKNVEIQHEPLLLCVLSHLSLYCGYKYILSKMLLEKHVFILSLNCLWGFEERYIL